MHIGLVLECDYRDDATQEEAFEETFALVETAEDGGLHGVWLAERHFASPRRPLDAFGVGIPSVVSAPLVMASAIAARTRRLRVGVAVNVLPLCHPIRMAEEAATVDHVSRGRLDFGVGRSGFARAYEGYGIPYEESRERFQESLEVILKAWTQDRFSHQGKYFTFKDVCVLPKPFQKPYPPLRMAATTKDTFPQVGAMGYPIFVGLRGFDVPELAFHLNVYRDAWRQAGHPGVGDVLLRIPAYVADTVAEARSDPEESTMRSYRRLSENFARSAGGAGTQASEERAQRAERLSRVTYEDLLQDRLAYGTPEMVAQRLGRLMEELELSGIIVEPNVGGGVPKEKVERSVRLFAQEVARRLR